MGWWQPTSTFSPILLHTFSCTNAEIRMLFIIHVKWFNFHAVCLESIYIRLQTIYWSLICTSFVFMVALCSLTFSTYGSVVIVRYLFFHWIDGSKKKATTSIIGLDVLEDSACMCAYTTRYFLDFFQKNIFFWRFYYKISFWD